MDRAHALTAPDPHRLARAFLALGDESGSPDRQRSASRGTAALLAALVLALGAPLTWMAPAAGSPAKPGDQPAATLGSSKAVLAAGDDEDDAGE